MPGALKIVGHNKDHPKPIKVFISHSLIDFIVSQICVHLRHGENEVANISASIGPSLILVKYDNFLIGWTNI